MSRKLPVVALALALPLLAACQDAAVGLQGVDQLERLGGAFGRAPHAPESGPGDCPADHAPARCR